jgi:site-specific DNA-methyltransferase (adenine-specific)
MDKETEFLNLSKKRKQEIENPQTYSAYRKKLVGFLDNKQLDLFLVNEPDILYHRDLIFENKKS